jgi:hypothetical protein
LDENYAFEREGLTSSRSQNLVLVLRSAGTYLATIVCAHKMDARRMSFIQRLLSLKYGTAVTVLLLVITLNSTLLFLSQLLQHSNARLYHHGESRSYMGINVAGDRTTEGHEIENTELTPSSALRSAVSSLSSAIDNISGRDQQHILNSPPVDIVYTWVNGSDPKQIKGSFFETSFHRFCFQITSIPITNPFFKYC